MAGISGISLKQLRALTAVDESGTLAEAGNTLGITAPAVHTQLKLLAENLGADVVKKASAGNLEITEIGRVVLSATEIMESALQRCVREVNAIRDGHKGLVRLGVVSTGKYFAPRLVALLKSTMPDIRVDLEVGNREAVIDALQKRRVDMAIMGRPPRQPLVRSQIIGQHPHVIIAPPNHQLAGQARIKADKLLKETFIVREQGSGTRILTTRYLDRIGKGQLYRQFELDSNETIKQAVIAGLGLALISGHTVAEELHSGRLAQIDAPGTPIERYWYLLRLENSELGPASLRVWERIAELRDEYLPDMP